MTARRWFVRLALVLVVAVVLYLTFAHGSLPCGVDGLSMENCK